MSAGGDLERRGRVMLGPFATPRDAFAAAEALLQTAPGVELVGSFLLPPADGPPSRPFQLLHVDFGLPLIPAGAADVARFTALHVPARAAGSGALTRLVDIGALLGQRAWPAREELVRRWSAYAHAHGARDGDEGYLEGSFARVVEASGDRPAALPSVRLDPGFLCGTEFDGLAAEAAFFAARGLALEPALTELPISPGGLLVFDNLRFAHGRRGSRRPGELHQHLYGERGAASATQLAVRDALLDRFQR